MNRRTFVAALAGLIVGPACALSMARTLQQPHLASISGYLMDRKRRGDMRVPHKPVTLYHIGPKASLTPVKRTRTDRHGRYEFTNVPKGLYYIQAKGSMFFPFYVNEPIAYWVSIFDHPLMQARFGGHL